MAESAPPAPVPAAGWQVWPGAHRKGEGAKEKSGGLRWRAYSEGQACARDQRRSLSKHWPTARRDCAGVLATSENNTETPALRELTSRWGSQIISSKYHA